MIVYQNNAAGSVTSGGTGSPGSGVTETWTVSTTTFPLSLNSGQYFHVVDLAAQTEKIKVTAVTGSGPYTWTVLRGDEGTGSVTHASGFTVQQVVTSGDFEEIDLSFFNVRKYGTIGNGVTDDTSAIQAALNDVANSPYGGVVFFPPGKYLISAALSYTSSSVPLRIMGSGSGEIGGGALGAATMIRPNFVGHAFDIQNTPYCSVTDLAIFADGTNTGGAAVDYCGIYTKSVYTFECDRVQIQQGTGNSSFNTAIHVAESNVSIITAGNVSGEQEGVWMDAGTGMVLRDLWVASTAGNGYGAVRMDNTIGGSSGPATLSMFDVTTFRGDWGFYGGGTGNLPLFVYCENMQVNNPRVGGFYMQSGSQVWLDYIWISMSGTPGGNNTTGIKLDTGFQGWFYLDNSVIQSPSNHGMLISGGQGINVTHTSFGGCGHATNNTWDDLHIGTGVSNVTVSDCHFDVDKYNTLAGTKARSAVYVESGATSINLNGCQATSSAYGTAPLIDLSSGQVQRIGNIGLGTPDKATDLSVLSATGTGYTSVTKAWAYYANDASPGTVYRVKVYGNGTQAGTAAVVNLHITAFGLGSLAVAEIPAAVPASQAFGWSAEAVIVVRTSGSSGTCDSYISGTVQQFSATPVTSFLGQSTGVTFDSTSSSTIVVQAEWVTNTGTFSGRASSFERIDATG